MRFRFDCRHVVPECEGKVRGDTHDEVVEKATRHVREVHGMELLEPGTLEMVRAGIVAADE